MPNDNDPMFFPRLRRNARIMFIALIVIFGVMFIGWAVAAAIAAT